MNANRMPSVMCIGIDLDVSAIHREAMTSATNTDSDQAIEDMLRSDGLNATTDNAAISKVFRMFDIFKINFQFIHFSLEFFRDIDFYRRNFQITIEEVDHLL